MPTTDRTSRGSPTGSHLTSRVAAVWVLVAVLCAAGLSVTSVEPAGAAPVSRYNPCGDSGGITVVVDFQGEGGRGLEAGCATGNPEDGLEAIRSAGFGLELAQVSGGVVCRIEAQPSTICTRMPPADAFWSYWLAPAGTSSWRFSNLGAGNRTPDPGTIEGWSFSRTKKGEQAKAPRAWSPPVPAPTTTPSTSPPATSPAGSGGSGSGSGGRQPGGTSSGSVNPAKPGSATPSEPSTKPGETAAPGKNGTAASNDSAAGDGKPAKPGTTTPGGGEDGTPGTASSDGSVTGGDDASNGDEVASGRAADRQGRDVAASQRGADRTEPDRGSPVPLIFAAVAAVVLLGTGIRASRRNRAAS